MKFSAENHPLFGHTNLSECIEKVAGNIKDKYLCVLEFAGIKVDTESASAKFGGELALWLVPLGKGAKSTEYTGLAVKHELKQVTKWLQKSLDQAGVQVAEEALESGFLKVAEQEYLQVQKKALKEIPLKVETKGATKAINLPSWKTIKINMEHIKSGHIEGGYRIPGSNKTCFPDSMSAEQVEKAIRQAYKHGKKVDTQGARVVVEGAYDGMEIRMYINTNDKIIETAFPKK